MTEVNSPLNLEAAPAARMRWTAAKALALWAVLVVALLPVIWTDHYNGDEFHFLTQVKRMVAGEVPTRDFFEFVMPGSLLMTAAWFKLTGVSLLAARVLQLGLVVALALAYGWLGRALGLGRGLAALVPVVVLGVFYTWHPEYAHHWFAQAGVAATLVALWAALGSRKDLAWVGVGAAVGLTYVMQQLAGGALLAGMGLGALWVAWRQGWGWGVTLRRAGLFLAGAAAPLLALAGYFALNGTLGQAVWMTHVWALGHYRSLGNHNDVAYMTDLSWMLSPRRIWINLVYWYAGLSVYLFTALLPVAALVGGGAWLLGRKEAGDRATAFLGVLVLTCGLLFLASIRGRADLTHVMYMATPAVLLLACAIAAWQRHLANMAGTGLMRGLPAVLLAGVVACQLYMEAMEFRLAPGSVLSTQTPDARITSREAFRALRPMVSPGDTILAINGAAEATIFYFYLAPNATRYTTWVAPEDGYTTPEQFQEIQDSVTARRPRLILYPHRTRERADHLVGRFFPEYRYAATLPFPEDVPWVTPRQVFVYTR